MIGSCIVLWAREHNDWVMYCTVGKENIMIGSCIVLWAKQKQKEKKKQQHKY